MSYTVVVNPTTQTLEVTSVNQVVEVNNVALPPLGRIRAIAFMIDGGGSAIEAGSKGYLEIPFDCVISEWNIIADRVGTVTIDIKKANYSSFPNSVSITGSEKPLLSNAQKNQDTVLSTWTTSLSAGDILEYIVDNSTTIHRITVVLKVIN